MFLSVVIPVYNEAEIIADTLAELSAFCASFEECESEIILSDDGSTDDSMIRAENCGVRFVRAGTEENHGKGSAVRHGVSASHGDVVLITDCDLAYGTEQMKNVVNKLVSDGADLLCGSRRLTKDAFEGYGLVRKTASVIYFALIRLMTHCSVSDSQAGLKCWRGEAARSVYAGCITDSFAYDIEAIMIAEKNKMKITEFPVKIMKSDSDTGRKSKVRLLKDAVKMIRDVKIIKKHLRYGDDI